MPHHPRGHFYGVAADDGWVCRPVGGLVRAIDRVIQGDRLLREGERLPELADMAIGRAHHYPEVHKRFGAQAVRLSPHRYSSPISMMS